MKSQTTEAIVNEKRALEKGVTPFKVHPSMKEQYQRLLRAAGPNDRLAILIAPDPDAIASAMALRRLFWRKIKGSAIYYTKPMQRIDNLTLIRMLNVTLFSLQQMEEHEMTKFAIVDSQPHHDALFQHYKYDIIIDHHPIGDMNKASFVDIRPEYGANSSILTEYLRAARIQPSAKLASALFYGIKTDTNNFVREATDNDMRAFRYLFHFANMNVVKKIESSEITKKTLEYYKLAMEKLKFWKGIAYAHLGSMGNPDICVQMADFFLKLTEASWSIISGVYGGKAVIIFRNDGYRKNAGKTAKRLFGEFGNAGGHKAAARAEMAIKDIKPHMKKGDEVETFIFRLVKSITTKRVPTPHDGSLKKA